MEREGERERERERERIMYGKGKSAQSTFEQLLSFYHTIVK